MADGAGVGYSVGVSDGVGVGVGVSVEVGDGDVSSLPTVFSVMVFESVAVSSSAFVIYVSDGLDKTTTKRSEIPHKNAFFIKNWINDNVQAIYVIPASL